MTQSTTVPSQRLPHATVGPEERTDTGDVRGVASVTFTPYVHLSRRRVPGPQSQNGPFWFRRHDGLHSPHRTTPSPGWRFTTRSPKRGTGTRGHFCDPNLGPVPVVSATPDSRPSSEVDTDQRPEEPSLSDQPSLLKRPEGHWKQVSVVETPRRHPTCRPRRRPKTQDLHDDKHPLLHPPVDSDTPGKRSRRLAHESFLDDPRGRESPRPSLDTRSGPVLK